MVSMHTFSTESYCDNLQLTKIEGRFESKGSTVNLPTEAIFGPFFTLTFNTDCSTANTRFKLFLGLWMS